MTQENKNNINFNFENTYVDLPKSFYSEISLSPVISPELIILNKPLAKSLGLDIKSLESQEGVEILSGNKKAKNGAYIAQAYGGHQFGHFNMLGDGRALLIGEQKLEDKSIPITNLQNKYKKNNRFDIQLKGSGKTPYSRGGDGRAVLGPMLREYIISEAMYNLNIPTTRSLAVVKTGEKVYREYIKDGAILTRVASSHIRFGTFEYASNFLSDENLKKLADYSIERHYPYIRNDENKYLSLLKEVINVQSTLVAKWQSIGFIHGVMNTDNMTISGETIDYGPCAFMDTYNPNTVFSSIDVSGRYAFKNQPNMTSWNICRFAETLLPLIHDDVNEAIDMVQREIFKFTDLYSEKWTNEMGKKLGLFRENESLEEIDRDLIDDLLEMMEKYKEDYTNTFVSLTYRKNMNEGMFASAEFTNWHKRWQDRLDRQKISLQEAYDIMKKNNPVFIPRNHKVEEALESAEEGDLSKMKKLLEVLENPYEYNEDLKEYMQLPEPSSMPYRTYCGT